MAINKREGPLSTAEGTEQRHPCLRCAAATVHRVLKSVEYVSSHRDGSFSMMEWDEFQILECRGCETISFRKRHRDTESTQYDDETSEEELIPTEELFPSRGSARPELTDLFQVPWAVQQVYREILAALRNSMPVLAGIGIRAMVESICNDRDAPGNNLEQKIDGLVSSGALTQDGASILHSLRIMGNQSAHEVRPHPTRDLEVALDVIEHVLTGIYILPNRAAHLPPRRNDREPR